MIDVIVVGCGASGIVAAIKAKKKNNRVVVLERNSKPLKKLLMTGNGRCNYMNEIYGTKFYQSEDIDIVSQIISDQNLFLVREFFDELGIVPKIKNGYYYPYSNQAVTIYHALVEKALSLGVEIISDTLVLDIRKDQDRFFITCEDCEYTSFQVVLSTGSKAYPKTGSDGMGYRFLEKFGHTIVEPFPALVQLTSDFPYRKEWDGVRSEVEIELFEDHKFVMRECGEIQFTRYGVSGICVFNLSNYLTRRCSNHLIELHVNLVPFIETLITPWMDSYCKKHSDKILKSLLEGFLNDKLVPIILKLSHLDENKYYQELSNSEKLLLCKNLRSLPILITGTQSFDSAQICNGGIKLTEIDSSTMESNFISGLYIVGELLDMNGNCGGYNLTTCWISGILAGRAIGDMYD